MLNWQLSKLLRGWTLSLLVLALSTGFAVPIQAGEANSDRETLRAVTLLYRHSAISPKYTPPKVDVAWPMGPRQLTAVGMRDMYDKGRALRKKYVEELGLITGTYHQSEIYVRASNTDRALQSAQLLMLGLYPLGVGPDPAVYDTSLEAAPAKTLAFTPVPIHSVALNNDAVLRPWTGQADCKRYKKFVKALPNTELYRTQGEKYRDFLTRISQITGMKEGQKPNEILYFVNEIYEPLSAHLPHNFPLPEGMSKQDLGQLGELADWNYHHQFLGKKVGALTGGPFVGEVLSNFTRVVEDKPEAKKLYLYSAHQRTILGVEAALGVETARTDGPLYAGRVPPLASHYAFEMHELDEGDYAVRLKFVTDEGEKLIQIPGCDSETCPLRQFTKIIEAVVPTDWRRACKV